MNFVRSMYASVSAIIRGDKSLNKKRENPYINTKEEAVQQEESKDDELEKKNEVLAISEDPRVESNQNKISEKLDAKKEEDDDEEEIDDDLMLHKKRKLSPCHILTEEQGITKEWENDFKIIKKNLERMNNLFKFYEDSANKKQTLANLPRVVV